MSDTADRVIAVNDIQDDLYVYRQLLAEEKDYDAAFAADQAIDFVDGVGKGLYWHERKPLILDSLGHAEENAEENVKHVFAFARELVQKT